MSSDMIAARSGITKRTVLYLSRQLTWAGHLNDFDRFTHACGVNMDNRHEQRWRRFNRDGFAHIRKVVKGTGPIARFYVELMQTFVKSKKGADSA